MKRGASAVVVGEVRSDFAAAGPFAEPVQLGEQNHDANAVTAPRLSGRVPALDDLDVVVPDRRLRLHGGEVTTGVWIAPPRAPWRAQAGWGSDGSRARSSCRLNAEVALPRLQAVYHDKPKMSEHGGDGELPEPPNPFTSLRRVGLKGRIRDLPGHGVKTHTAPLLAFLGATALSLNGPMNCPGGQ